MKKNSIKIKNLVLICFLCFALHCSLLLSQSKAGIIDSSFYKEYFSYNISKRLEFVKYNTDGLWQTIGTIERDFNALLQFNMRDSRYFKYDNVMFRLKDTTAFIQKIDSLIAENKLFANVKSKNLKLISARIYSDSSKRYFKSYLFYNLKNRIAFFEKYYDKFGPFYLLLVQSDLDSLLGIWTKSLLKDGKTDRKNIADAVAKWKKEYEKKHLLLGNG